MTNKKTILLTLIFSALGFGQGPIVPPTPVKATQIFSISATTVLDCAGVPTCIDNRSAANRQNNFHSYRASGSGTWMIDMQWADGSSAGPWTSYGSTGQVSSMGPQSGIGYGIDPVVTAGGHNYHDFVRFVITGAATIQNYNGVRGFWSLPSAGSLALPITANQGGTSGLIWPDVFSDNITDGCASAAMANETLILTQDWGIPTSGVLNCRILAAGGIITPAAGAVVHVPVRPISNYTQMFNTSAGGPGSIVLDQGYSVPEWFGAKGYQGNPGPSTSVDSAPGFMGAAHACPVTGCVLDMQAQTYYMKSAQTIQFPAFDFPVTQDATFRGNGAIIDYSGMPNQGVSAQVFGTQPTGTQAFQTVCTGSANCVSISAVALGANTVTVSDPTKFAVQHEIYLQGGGNGSGSEVNSELNVVASITGSVIGLQTPTGKAYVTDSTWPLKAMDVDVLTVKNFTAENMTLQGNGVFPIVSINNDGQTLRNVRLTGPGQNAIITGYNRNWTLDNYYAELLLGAGCPGGGFLQISQSSSFVEIKNSEFNNQQDINCGIGLTEGSFNFKFHNNETYNTSVVGNLALGGGIIEIRDNNWTINGTVANDLGTITNNCCGGNVAPMIVTGNFIQNNNTGALSILLGGASTVTGNTINHASTTTYAVAVTNFTGGSVSGNIINTANQGILVGGVPDFPVNGNTITGASFSGSTCITFAVSTSQPSGPLATGNHCKDFTTGISTSSSNLSFFVGRGIGLNSFENVTTSYTPVGLTVSMLSPSGDQNLFNGQPANTSYANGNVMGPSLFVRSVPAGVTYTVGDAFGGSCNSNCSGTIYAPDNAQVHFPNIVTPTYNPNGGWSLVGGVPTFCWSADGTVNTACVNPNNFLITKPIVGNAAAWPTSMPSTHCEAWNNGGVLNVTTCP